MSYESNPYIKTGLASGEEDMTKLESEYKILLYKLIYSDMKFQFSKSELEYGIPISGGVRLSFK